MRRSVHREPVRRNAKGEERGREGKGGTINARLAAATAAAARRVAVVAAVVKSEFRGRKKATWLLGCLLPLAPSLAVSLSVDD